MDISTFFLLNSTFSQTPFCFGNSTIDYEKSIEILKGNYQDTKFPIVLSQISGKKWTDILNPTSAFFIISKKFASLLIENKITGWKPFEIVLFEKNGVLNNDYLGFSVTGKSENFDYSKSEIIEKRLVPNGTLDKYFKGMHLDLEKWDNSDIFIPETTTFVICSKKVQEIIIKNKLTNFLLENLAEVEMLDYKLED